MSKTRDIKFGIIGLGNHAQENLIPALRLVDGVEIYALQSRDRERIERTAARYKIELNNHPVDLMEDAQCDGIIVSATPMVHQDLLLQAVQNGQNIFVEKPPAPDLTAFLEIKKQMEANSASPIVQFGFNFRYSDFYRQIEGMTDEGKDIRYMKIKSYAAKPNCPMWHYEGVLESSMYAVHIHAIEMLCYSLGRLNSIKYQTAWIDDNRFILTVFASFEDGKLGVLELSNASNRFEFDVECIDSRANILRCMDFNHLEVFGPDVEVGRVLGPKSRTTYDIPFLRGGFDRTGYSKQFEKFRDSINKGKIDTRSMNSCEDAYRIIKEITK